MSCFEAIRKYFRSSRINAVDSDGLTLLLDVNFELIKNDPKLQKTQEDAVTRYLEEGGDINAEDINGRTPLIVAVMKRNEPLVSQLLRSGADVTATWSGLTALRWAVGLQEVSIAALLIKHGSDVNCTFSYDGNTLLMSSPLSSRHANTFKTRR